jgi:signal transduction histidine kinase
VRRVALALAGLVALAAAAAAERASGLRGLLAAGDLTAGVALVGAGALAWDRRAQRGVAALLAATGFAWFVGDLWTPLLFTHRGPLAHLLLAYPSGRLRSRLAWATVVAAYVDGLVFELGATDGLTVALGVGLVAVAALRWRSAAGLERRARGAALAAASAVGGVLAVAAAARVAGSQDATAASLAYDAALTLVALGLVADLRWGRWTAAAVTGLVVDVGELERPASLQGKLAAAIGDPSLVVGYRLPDGSGFVDEEGRAVALPAPGDARAATMIEDAGEPIAVLLHDAAVLADPQLVTAVAAAARLAVGNARLQGEVRARLADIEASRRRIVEAGDRQRRRLQEEILAGPERRLATAAHRLDELAAGANGDARASVLALREDLSGGRDALRRFAGGLHPPTLTDGGLRPALAELAAQSQLPVDLQVTAARLPQPVEVAAYFVCSEALANVTKYASATRTEIRVVRRADALAVTIADDGAGGADPARGSGLHGLADRVEAQGGVLRVDSPRGAGTIVEAVIPVDVDDSASGR